MWWVVVTLTLVALVALLSYKLGYRKGYQAGKKYETFPEVYDTLNDLNAGLKLRNSKKTLSSTPRI